jgi:UDPglucose 6-dehydrogenase
MKKYKIVIVGAGYVGMSLAVLLAQHNDVCVLDVDANRVEKINRGQSTVEDTEIVTFLAEKSLSLSATCNKREAYVDAHFIVVATPTDYDDETHQFNTCSVDSVVAYAIEFNRQALVVIKSTVPVGHTANLQRQLSTDRIIFSPEFLREGSALLDNLYPSRIVIGGFGDAARAFGELLQNGAIKKSIDTLYMPSPEAEAAKLFANTYLAMRVAFFNELDSFALHHQLKTRSIIDAVCLDERINSGYNNPSFGYGGYCLPKDTQQLLANYGKIPQTLVQAIIASNTTRQDFIVQQLLAQRPSSVGVYRLAMKEGSDNIRSSAVLGILQRLLEAGVGIVIYEPSLTDRTYQGAPVITELADFKARSDLIIANRIDNQLDDVAHKLFSRDLFGFG